MRKMSLKIMGETWGDQKKLYENNDDRKKNI